MNILYLCADRGIPVRGYKGAAVHVRALTDAFARAGHSVTILTPRLGPADGPAPQAILVEVPASKNGIDDGDPETVRELKALQHADDLLEAAEALHCQRSFDLIYERYSLWSDAGATLAARTGLPFVLEVNAPLIEEAQRYRSLTNDRRAGAIERMQFSKATALAVVSDQLKEYAVSRGASPQRVQVLPNGVDPQHFHPAVRGGDVRCKYNLDERLVVGFVGRPRPWHDLETLLRAVASLRESDERYHLLLVGEMPDELPAQLASYGLSDAATLTGPVAHQAVPEHIAAMDVAVSPHLPLTEFYFSPLKLFEYLACGVPVVAADIGQPSHVIRHGETGLLYTPGDSVSLAAGIRRLIQDPALAREIAWQGAISVLSGYTWDRNAQRVVELAQADGAGRPVALAESHDLPYLDPKLRQRLYRATRADLAAPLLAQALKVYGKRGRERLEAVERIEVLKYKPGRRCVLAYDLRGRVAKTGQPTHRRVIGKVFRDERGLRLHRLQQVLWQNGFGPDASDRIGVPQSLGYSDKMRMQVQELSAGDTLDELAGRVDLLPLIPRCAHALAKLHASGVPFSRSDNGAAISLLGSYSLPDEERSLDIYAAEMMANQPAETRDLRDGLARWAQHLPPLPAASPVHRDFYYSQVLIDGDRCTLIDFDLLAWGDPAIDVANFTAHLRLLGMFKLGSGEALDREADLFMDAYARQASIDEPFCRRWAFYQAATYFRLITVAQNRPFLTQYVEELKRQTVASLQQA